MAGRGSGTATPPPPNGPFGAHVHRHVPRRTPSPPSLTAARHARAALERARARVVAARVLVGESGAARALADADTARARWYGCVRMAVRAGVDLSAEWGLVMRRHESTWCECVLLAHLGDIVGDGRPFDAIVIDVRARTGMPFGPLPVGAALSRLRRAGIVRELESGDYVAHPRERAAQGWCPPAAIPRTAPAEARRGRRARTRAGRTPRLGPTARTRVLQHALVLAKRRLTAAQLIGSRRTEERLSREVQTLRRAVRAAFVDAHASRVPRHDIVQVPAPRPTAESASLAHVPALVAVPVAGGM